MRIAAWSDGHGILPVIEDGVDIMIVAGDIVPLDIQRDQNKSRKWIIHTLFEYVRNLKVDKFIVVPGNHDFIFQWLPIGEMDKLIEDAGLRDKFIYLEDKLYEYNDLKIYGCPWCTGPFGWAFSPGKYFTDISSKYEMIPDCDILITHQPPKIDKLGCSYPYQPYERDFGSDRLKAVFDEKNVKYAFCGHIHSGLHNGIKYGETTLYNVSLLDEDYESTYLITYLDI